MDEGQVSIESYEGALRSCAEGVSVSLTQHVSTTRQKLAAGEPWDLVVIGAGITGAGIARLAARRGWNVLLLERGDLAGGTSSLSSKMVHGGLRYLAQGQVGLTRKALSAREQLLKRWPDLVHAQRHALVHRNQDSPPAWLAHLGTWAYFLLSGAPWYQRPRYLDKHALHRCLPQLDCASVQGASLYFDALCDDSQLVLRTLNEALYLGAGLSHYTEVTALTYQDGICCGVEIQRNGETLRVTARGVINATGVWASDLCELPEGLQLKPQRGSHLMFRHQDLPIDMAITLRHPRDDRVVFCYPWGGGTVLGTTDLDHLLGTRQPVQMSREEQAYLLELLPQLGINKAPPILACWAGLRPILVKPGDSGNPSDHSREHLVWEHPGLVNVTGGKLTTFENMAEEALCARQLEQAQIELPQPVDHPMPRISPVPVKGPVIDGSLVSVTALSYWASQGAIEQLSDLLLRRTRAGWLLGESLAEYQDEIEHACASLGWTQAQWHSQWQKYWQQWCQLHRPYNDPASAD